MILEHQYRTFAYALGPKTLLSRYFSPQTNVPTPEPHVRAEIKFGLDVLERRLRAVGTYTLNGTNSKKSKNMCYPSTPLRLLQRRSALEGRDTYSEDDCEPAPPHDSAISSSTLAGRLGRDDSDGEFDGRTHRVRSRPSSGVGYPLGSSVLTALRWLQSLHPLPHLDQDLQCGVEHEYIGVGCNLGYQTRHFDNRTLYQTTKSAPRPSHIYFYSPLHQPRHPARQRCMQGCCRCLMLLILGLILGGGRKDGGSLRNNLWHGP
jgi:hypothetical protein